MSSTKIRAAVCTAFGVPLQIETLNLADPAPGQVQVKVDAVAICHSDIVLVDGGWGGTLPAVYGHEAAGRITKLGTGVTDLAEGEPVVVTLINACGTCPTCAGGRPVLCATPKSAPPSLSRPDGTPVTQGLACGAFAEAVTVSRGQVVAVPEGTPMAPASLLACGVITGVGAAVMTAQVRPGEVVVVIGAGGVGLNAIQGARLAGASRVVAVDMQASKLDDAMAFGATDGLLAEGTPWEALRKIAPRGADVVIVSVGVIPAYNSADKYLGMGGRLVAVGMPHSGQVASYEPDMLAYAGKTIVGSKMGDVVLARDIPWMVDLYQQGRLQLDALVSNTFPLEQINEAIASTRAGKARRNVILL